MIESPYYRPFHTSPQLFVKSFPLLFVIGIFVLGLLPAAALDLHITVLGIRNDKGKIAALVFTNSDGFPDQPIKAVARARVDAHTGKVTFTLKNIPAGKVAVAVLHDEDANGHLNRNFLGIPLEGVGLSGKPMGGGPPSYKDAEVGVPANRNLEIGLKYGFTAGATKETQAVLPASNIRK